MGYNVHIVRTDDWFDSETNPVTKNEIDRALEKDPTLSWSDTDYIEMAEKDGSVKRYFLINWNSEAVFWWYKSEVTCKNPNEEQLLKLVELASSLGAYVVGDDGEKYEGSKSVDGKLQVFVRREQA